MKKSVKSILVLVTICAVVSVLMALTNSITAPIIDKNAQATANAALLEVLKHFKVPLLKFRPIDEAIITSGGIEVREINPKTMESKLVSGLYFAGEVLDLDAYTGGFNLQIAFSTATLAGENAAWSSFE